jgi:hypothetical protein
LFAIVVERVSGLSLAAFTKKYIFEPAGMTRTEWRDDPNRVVVNRAIAYITSNSFRADSTYNIDMPNEYAYGNGGLLTTADDLLKWNNFYLSGKFGSPSLLSEQTKTEPLTNGAPNHYAAGLNIEEVMGWKNINHAGATASYAAYLELFPELRLSFAIINNSSEFFIVDQVDKVRKILIHDKSVKPAPVTGVNLPDAALDNFTGMYLNGLDGSTVQVIRKNGNLVTDNGTVFTAISTNVFKTPDKTCIFDRNGVTSVSRPGDTIRFIKVNPYQPTLKDMDYYAGKYFSDETTSSMQIVIDKGKLMMKLGGDAVFELTPTFKDAFEVKKLGANLKFVRNSRAKIVIIKVNAERARGIIYQKSSN